jgi:hypothetical protein
MTKEKCFGPKISLAQHEDFFPKLFSFFFFDNITDYVLRTRARVHEFFLKEKGIWRQECLFWFALL